MPTWVKFCGCRSVADVEMAREAGADAIGMIFAPSVRGIAIGEAAAIAARTRDLNVEPVAVFVDPSEDEIARVRELFPSIRVQFSGNEPADFVARFGDAAIKAVHVAPEHDERVIGDMCRRFPEATILFDTKDALAAGGTGRTFDWERVARVSAQRKTVMAGGLTPQNVGACIRSVRPQGVDVRSGVESGDRKDAAKMRAFVRAVREADEA